MQAELGKLRAALLAARNDSERDLQVDNLYRKVHFITASAGLARCCNLALLSNAFEAMLFEVVQQPSLLTQSALHTAAAAAEFLGALPEQGPGDGPPYSIAATVLVVDDDPITNRLVVAGLMRAQLQARSTESPLAALQMLREKQFDLLLLDIEMPEMDGYELCKQIRALPAYQNTPVVFVTRHSDFDSRAKATLSGGNDLIGKPFFALELAVKAVTHLLRNRLAKAAIAQAP
jgi:CheY-like chemotaxis protein